MASKKYKKSECDAPLVAEPMDDYNNSVVLPVPTQIMVNIEDVSMLKEIKHAISMIRGVVSVEKSPAMKSYERARADVKAGRVVEFENLDDLKAFYDKL